MQTITALNNIRQTTMTQLAHNVILTLVKGCINVKAYLTLTQHLHNFAFLF